MKKELLKVYSDSFLSIAAFASFKDKYLPPKLLGYNLYCDMKYSVVSLDN